MQPSDPTTTGDPASHFAHDRPRLCHPKRDSVCVINRTQAWSAGTDTIERRWLVAAEASE
jgi:hypothetical protein